MELNQMKHTLLGRLGFVAGASSSGKGGSLEQRRGTGRPSCLQCGGPPWTTPRWYRHPGCSAMDGEYHSASFETTSYLIAIKILGRRPSH